MTETISEQVIAGILEDAHLPHDSKTVYEVIDYLDVKLSKVSDDFTGVGTLEEEGDNNEVH